jgi:hypothetical protein
VLKNRIDVLKNRMCSRAEVGWTQKGENKREKSGECDGEVRQRCVQQAEQAEEGTCDVRVVCVRACRKFGVGLGQRRAW